MIKLLPLGLFLIALIAPWIASVTPDDIAHKFNLGRAYAAVNVESGDIYAVRPDETSIFRVCAMERLSFEDEQREEMYDFRNRVGVRLPALWKLLPEAVQDNLSPADAYESSQVRFSGTYSEVIKFLDGGPQSDCYEELARLQNSRNKLCIVTKVLKNNDFETFSAFGFHPLPMIIPEEVYHEYGLQKSDAARMVEQQGCPVSTDTPWDVKLRSFLRVIDMRAVSG